MKRIATTLTALLLMAGTATAQDYGQARTLKIWDNKTAPHGNGIATPEREPEKNRLTDVSEAVLYIFRYFYSRKIIGIITAAPKPMI